MQKPTFTKTEWETKKFKIIKMTERKGWFSKTVKVYIKPVSNQK